MSFANSSTSLWRLSIAILPGVAIALPQSVSRGLYVGTTGNVEVHPVDNAPGVNVIYPSVPAGTTLKCIIDSVVVAGTTASGFVGGQ